MNRVLLQKAKEEVGERTGAEWKGHMEFVWGRGHPSQVETYPGRRHNNRGARYPSTGKCRAKINDWAGWVIYLMARGPAARGNASALNALAKLWCCDRDNRKDGCWRSWGWRFIWERLRSGVKDALKRVAMVVLEKGRPFLHCWGCMTAWREINYRATLTITSTLGKTCLSTPFT